MKLFNKPESTSEKTPELILVMGGVCTGKTTHRRTKYNSEDYIHIDAGELFLDLSQGEYYDFPSHLEAEMNYIGLEKCYEAIVNKANIVLEIIGSDKEGIDNLVEFAKQLNYTVNVDFLDCELEVAMQRNENRTFETISAYYCEPYHFYWFKKAAAAYLNQ